MSNVLGNNIKYAEYILRKHDCTPTYFLNFLENQGFIKIVNFIKSINIQVIKKPIYAYENEKYIIRYSDNNEFVFELHYDPNWGKYRACSFYYRFSKFKTMTVIYDLAFTHYLTRYSTIPNDVIKKNWIDIINHNISESEILENISPINFKAEILISGQELKTIGLFETNKKDSVEKLKKLYPNCTIVSLNEVNK